MESHEIEIAVEEGDIDRLGHVNNVTYVRWVQEAAIAHWEAAALPEDLEKVLWVVVRHEVDYKAAAFRGDRVKARTWVGAATRIRFERHTEITRASDGVLLAKAVTIWIPVDARTLKPISAPPSVRARFSAAG